MRAVRFLVLAAGVLVLAPRSLPAAVPGYTVQTIAKTGDTVADVQIARTGYIDVGSINDNGEIAFIALQSAGNGEMLLQYSKGDGKFTPIVVGGRDAPGGKWTRGGGIWAQVSMNQQGDMAFTTVSPSNTYVYSRQSGQARLVAAKGMPAINDLTFAASGDQAAPAINDVGEIAFQAIVKDSAGQSSRTIFFRSVDGKLTPVVRSGDTVAGVGTINLTYDAPFSLSNSGVVAFEARRAGDTSYSLFTWEKGAITPVLLAGADAPSGGKFALLRGPGINSQNQNMIVFGNLDGDTNHFGVYGLAGGRLTPLAVPGQEMPGGGQCVGGWESSFNTAAGEYAWIFRLADGDLGIYHYHADGQLTLVAKSGDLGAKIDLSDNSGGIAINSKGQITLPVRFTGDPVDSLILLTSVSP
jgi:hypothetical protein